MMSANAVFEKFADKEGLVSLTDLLSVGWTKQKAQDEGIVIKEDFYHYDTDLRKSVNREAV